MKPACLRQTELPHSSRLFTDFLYHYNRVSKYYTTPLDRAGFAEERRAGLVDALSQSNSGESLRRLANPGTVAVVTGQQVGLFSGPAYTIYKALTAARYAQWLTEQGIEAVPVFWLATEDHDFVEIDHTWLFDAENQPSQVRVVAPNGGRPVGGLSPKSWPIEALRQALGGMPHAGEVLDAVRDAYRPGETMGSSFRRLMERLLAPYGFLFVDPLEPAFRCLAAPLLRRAVEAAPELTGCLLARNRELEANGYHAQVHIEEKTSLFFLLENGLRLHLRRAGENYLLDGRRLSAPDLAARAEHISPNAALRPVIQDFVLPTAAYIGGPAELAYFAQSQVLYESLEVPMPRLLSRSGFTLLDPRAQKLLETYNLRVQDCFHGELALRERAAAALVPAGLQTQFEDATASAAALLDRLDSNVRHFDATLSAALGKSRSKILYQLGKIQSKVAREALRRDERAQADAAYLYNGVYPHKHLQERFYSILPFLARHGFQLIEELHEAVQLECPDHILLPLN